MAIINANADPMRRELAAVKKMADQTGASLSRGMSGGGHAGTSGIMRETLVLMREISRGNWTRVPGSFTLLLQRMGVLNLLVRDSASASKILADAWGTQAEAAGVAAIAATRKASASLAAFEADEANTAATLEQAVADEEGAAAAITNAKAIQTKAIAAQEAAAAQSAAATTGIGALGITAGVVVGLLAGIYLGVKQVQAATSALSGLGFKNFNPEHIANKNQAANRPVEEQKEINREIQKTVDLYNSAAKAAERTAEATKSHFEHLRKMASYERDPVKRAQQELEIDKQERNTEVSNKKIEQVNLTTESAARRREAEAIKVSSKEEDENRLRAARQAKEDAEKFLETGTAKTFGNALVALNPFSHVSVADINKGFADKTAEAHQRINNYNKTVDDVAANDELRKRREELIKQSGSSAAAAAGIGLSIPEMQKRNAQANADAAKEAAAKLAGEGKTMHGHVNALQQIGAYAAPAVHVDIARRQLDALHQIQKNTAKIGGLNSVPFDAPRF